MIEKKDDLIKTKIKTNNDFEFKIDPKEMLEAGIYFGHKTTKTHPKMMPYIAGVKNTVHIIDIRKSAQKLEKALKFIQELIFSQKTLLLVGTKIQFKKMIKDVAEECGLFYVNERWIGGTLTNFKEISKRIKYFKDIEKKKQEGQLEKYTKKERTEFDKELQRLVKKFEGIKQMDHLPDAIFVLDMKKDSLAIKEAKMINIPVIGIADTNVDPTLVDYVIPANDDAISSIKYILGKMTEVIKKAKLNTKDNKELNTKDNKDSLNNNCTVQSFQ